MQMVSLVTLLNPSFGVYMRLAIILFGSFVSSALSLKGALLVLVGVMAHTGLAMPLLTVLPASIAILTILASSNVYKAYKAFMTLGPGSVPRSMSGFVRTASIAWSGSSSVSSTTDGYLLPLPLRAGPTPFVSGHAPQQQINQHSPEDVQQYFADRLALFASPPSDSDHNAPGAGIAKSSACNCDSEFSLRTFGCEFCATRKAEGSAHVVLHPADFEQVLTKGWGEVHPLAGKGLPSTLALVYAPREYSEVCIAMSIIEAGAKFLVNAAEWRF